MPKSTKKRRLREGVFLFLLGFCLVIICGGNSVAKSLGKNFPHNSFHLTDITYQTSSIDQEINLALWLAGGFVLAFAVVAFLLIKKMREREEHHAAVEKKLKEMESKAKERAAELETVNNQLRTIFDNSQVGIMYLLGGRIFEKGNQRIADIFAYDSPEEMRGMSMRQLHLDQKRFEEFGERFFNLLAHGSKLHIEYRLARKDGTPVWCMLSGKAVDNNFPADVKKGVIWVVEDISHQKKMEENLRALANTDPLTGLCNRRRFMEKAKIEQERFRRYGQPFTLLMMDLDFFKDVNDSYGHEAGDKVLIAFAWLCECHFREVDIVGRIGGEEFAVILPATDKNAAVVVAQRFRNACADNSIIMGNLSIKVTVSIGIAQASKDEVGIQALICNADRALYQAKDKGRNRVEMS